MSLSDTTLRVTGPASKRVLTLFFSFLIVHIVLHDKLAFEKYLETAWEEDGPWCNRVIFMTEVIPLLPLVDENAQIRWVLV